MYRFYAAVVTGEKISDYHSDSLPSTAHCGLLKMLLNYLSLLRSNEVNCYFVFFGSCFFFLTLETTSVTWTKSLALLLFLFERRMASQAPHPKRFLREFCIPLFRWTRHGGTALSWTRRLSCFQDAGLRCQPLSNAVISTTLLSTNSLLHPASTPLQKKTTKLNLMADETALLNKINKQTKDVQCWWKGSINI